MSNFHTIFLEKYEELFANGFFQASSIIIAIENALSITGVKDVVGEIRNNSIQSPLLELAFGYAFLRRSISKMTIRAGGERLLEMYVHWEKDDVTMALKYFNQVKNVFNSDLVYLYLLYVCYVIVGEHSKAVKEWDKLFENKDKFTENNWDFFIV